MSKKTAENVLNAWVPQKETDIETDSGDTNAERVDTSFNRKERGRERLLKTYGASMPGESKISPIWQKQTTGARGG
ncbi:MAG: hypothetical protein HYT27_01330 [Parcubacteria group bacterium]|nr:hypothetical protein [Parcubacteria group bacterium]